MRLSLTLLSVVFTTALFATAAHALDPDDTLARWAGPHFADRMRLVEPFTVGPRDSREWITVPYLLICLNEMAADPALQDKTIREAITECIRTREQQ